MKQQLMIQTSVTTGNTKLVHSSNNERDDKQKLIKRI